MPRGGTRCRRNSTAGARRSSSRPASAPCRTAIVRHSAYIAPGVVLMPSFVNLGAYVDEGTMVDTWVTVGSCAQIGKNCHLSGGVGIGGVLEPLQASPTIIEDNCFIGAALGSGRRRGRRRGLGGVDGRVHRRLDQDRRPRHRRGPHGPRAALFGGGFRRDAGQAAAVGAILGPSLYCAVIVKRSTRRRGPRPRSTNCCGTSPLTHGMSLART